MSQQTVATQIAAAEAALVAQVDAASERLAEVGRNTLLDALARLEVAAAEAAWRLDTARKLVASRLSYALDALSETTQAVASMLAVGHEDRAQGAPIASSRPQGRAPIAELPFGQSVPEVATAEALDALRERQLADGCPLGATKDGCPLGETTVVPVRVVPAHPGYEDTEAHGPQVWEGNVGVPCQRCGNREAPASGDFAGICDRCLDATMTPDAYAAKVQSEIFPQPDEPTVVTTAANPPLAGSLAADPELAAEDQNRAQRAPTAELPLGQSVPDVAAAGPEAALGERQFADGCPPGATPGARPEKKGRKRGKK